MTLHKTNIYSPDAEKNAQRPPECLASHARDLIAIMGGVKKKVDNNITNQN